MDIKHLINKQLIALHNVKQFLKMQDPKLPNLETEIWKRITHIPNTQVNLTHNINYIASDIKWATRLSYKLQQVLVNYQLLQMQIGKPIALFAVLKDIFTLFFFIAESQNLSELDIGCGFGYYFEVINFYFPNTFKYSGCDQLKEAICAAKERNPCIDFRVQQYNNMKYKDKAFDITLLSDWLVNFSNYEKALKEVCRITNKYIILHRIKFTDGSTKQQRSLKYFLPSLNHIFNDKTFFDIFEKYNFVLIWEQFIGQNTYTFLLKRIEL